MKKISFNFIIFILFFLIFTNIAQAEEPEIYFFHSPTCGHCAHEKEFIKDIIRPKYPELKINSYEIQEEKNTDLLLKLYRTHSVPHDYYGLVPITFIGDDYVLGYKENELIDKIASHVEKFKETESQEATDIEIPIENTESKNLPEIDISPVTNNTSDQKPSAEKENKSMNLPIIGNINLAETSPMSMAIILGTLDGFNACAMIALGFLLTVLVATGVRKKLILIGGTFIFISGFVYFLFIVAWLNLFLIVQHLKIITLGVGVIVIVFALLTLKDYFRDVICKICSVSPKGQGLFQKLECYLFEKLEKLVNSNASIPILIIGVALVAAGINMVELICSFGFPLAFTKALTSMDLSNTSYYFYLILYILFYMIDDFIIFLIAVFTLKITGISTKYLKVIKLISGIVLMLIGILLLFKPELLSFTF